MNRMMIVTACGLSLVLVSGRGSVVAQQGGSSSSHVMSTPAGHYAMTRGGATVQVHRTGPFVLNYVNPADDPRKAAAK
jgi:hypothetical protein